MTKTEKVGLYAMLAGIMGYLLLMYTDHAWLAPFLFSCGSLVFFYDSLVGD